MRKQQTILLIEDEITIRDVVRRYLEREGYRVLEADNGSRALDLLRQQSADLVLLDIMLPDADGFSIARAIRRGGGTGVLAMPEDTPLIMLTSRSEERDRLEGFELGVDDYVVKPFSPREIVARVKAVLRRSAHTVIIKTEDIIHFANLMIDPRRHVVEVRGASASLTTKEFDLLHFLAKSPRHVFTREQLLNHVWGYEFYGDESTVTVHIRRLREKIEVDPSKPTLIQTVWGLGYRFEPE
jgi:two-component system response regulator ResD